MWSFIKYYKLRDIIGLILEAETPRAEAMLKSCDSDLTIIVLQSIGNYTTSHAERICPLVLGIADPINKIPGGVWIP